jgi:flavodoxin
MIVSTMQNKKVVVFYGSQTGTAEEFAVRLAKESTRHGMPAMTFDPEECSEWVCTYPFPHVVCKLVVLYTVPPNL